jgi:hypothetical protein
MEKPIPTPEPATAPAKTPGDFIRVNALVTQAEHQKIKVYAAQNQTTISDIFRKLIKSLPD